MDLSLRICLTESLVFFVIRITKKEYIKPRKTRNDMLEDSLLAMSI